MQHAPHLNEADLKRATLISVLVFCSHRVTLPSGLPLQLSFMPKALASNPNLTVFHCTFEHEAAVLPPV